METENTRSTWIMIIIGIVVLGAIGIALWQKYGSTGEATEFQRADGTVATETGAWTNEPAASASTTKPKMVITAKHAFRNGEHIIAGSIAVPSSCHLLTQTTSASTDRKKAFIEFVAASQSADKCIPEPTPARFKITIRADRAAEFSATYNGEEAVLNLIEAGPNENLDNFELYIKG